MKMKERKRMTASQTTHSSGRKRRKTSVPDWSMKRHRGKWLIT
jgi:hypothetical protein